MAPPPQLRLPAALGLLHRPMFSRKRGAASLPVVEMVLGLRAASSCFLLHLCHLDLKDLTVWAGSLPSAAPPLLQHGALLPGLQDLSGVVGKGSCLGTTWFLLLTFSTALASSPRKAARRVVATCHWGGEDVEGIILMRLGGGDQ